MTDNTRELIGIKEAERLIGKQLQYWISTMRGPKYEVVAGRKVFDKQDVLNWRALKKQPGKAKKESE